MRNLIKKAVMAGLGIEAKGREKLEELVRDGEESQTDCAKAVKKFMTEAGRAAEKLEKKVADAWPVAMRSDLERLEKKIQELASKITGGKA
jgi:hypothetical protein